MVTALDISREVLDPDDDDFYSNIIDDDDFYSNI
jgi:hypothetical protein